MRYVLRFYQFDDEHEEWYSDLHELHGHTLQFVLGYVEGILAVRFPPSEYQVSEWEWETNGSTKSASIWLHRR